MNANAALPLEVIVLAAGKGTRMISDKPKVLHELAGEPLLGHVLRAVKQLRPQAIHVVLGHGAGQVRERYAALQVGDPFDPATDRGPLAVERARDRVEQHVAGALEQGATLVTGGRRPPHLDRGWYYEPTLLADVDNSMRVAQEEIFGPVTCVIPYTGIDEAVAIANDSPFGLAASIYTQDQELALKVARNIRAGSVAVNQAGVSLTQPFGGYKQSGWGRECGAEGILEFTQIKQILTGGSYLDA